MAGRLATCDLGSNSILLLVVDVDDDGGLTRVHEGLALTRIGRGVGASGLFHPGSEAKTLAALAQFVEAAAELGAGPLQCVATAGLRDALPEERQRLLGAAAELGVDIEMIDGSREADLTALAVMRSLPRVGSDLWMVDVGGRSTEFVSIEAGAVASLTSRSLGGVGLTEGLLTKDPPGKELLARARAHAAEVVAAVRVAPEIVGKRPMVAAGGTATTLAAVLNRIDPYDADRVHGIRVPRADLSAGLDMLATKPLAQLLGMPGLVPGRADIAVGGAVALEAAALRLGAETIIVSDRGLRWGLAYELAQYT